MLPKVCNRAGVFRWIISHISFFALVVEVIQALELIHANLSCFLDIPSAVSISIWISTVASWLMAEAEL